MIKHRESTLNRPPNCPKNRGHLCAFPKPRYGADVSYPNCADRHEPDINANQAPMP